MTIESFNITAKWIIIAILIVCIAVASICIFKGCHPAPPVFNPTVLQDSVTQREKEMGYIIDSLISRNNHSVALDDSLGAIIVAQEIELNGRKVVTEKLSDDYKAYRQKYDTVNALHKCDTLAEEVTRQNLAIMEYEDSNGKLYDSLQSITGNNSLIIAKKDYLYSVLRSSFDSVIYQNQIQGLNLNKQKDKRWNVSIGGSSFYYNGIKIAPAVHVGYSIIRF